MVVKMIKKAAITIVIISSAMIMLGMLLAFMGLVLGGNPRHALHNINIRDDYQYNFNKNIMAKMILLTNLI